MFRRLTTSQLAVDLVIALVCVLLRLAIGVPGPLAIVVLLMGAALALSRLSPQLALAVAWVGAILQMLIGAAPDVSNAAILVVLYATARHGAPATRWAGLGSAGVGAIIAAVYFTFFTVGPVDPSPLWASVPKATAQIAAYSAGAFAVLGLSWTTGLLARTWDDARTARRAKTVAEKTVVVEQERNRIARDMHDVIAHSLAVVIAQADGARYAKDGATKDEALATISGTAREALADVRLLLGQLRHSQDVGPQPVLDDLDRLMDQLRSSGLTIRADRVGEPRVLPTSQQLAVYRIVQEALTNALRHGDTGQEVTVRLTWTPDAVEATVTSALRQTPEPNEGHGLPGMRERAILVGGTLDAGVEGDHWVVRVRIPAGEVVQ